MNRIFEKILVLIMKSLKTLITSATFIFITFSTFAQTSENPWAVAIGANLINLQGDDVNSNLNLGAPALSLSGYLTSGFSVGVKYGIGKAEPQDNVKRDYSYLDGIIRYNLSEENTVPYLFGGYGLSRFADGADKEGMFPSGESGRTTFGGIGVDIPIGDQININISTSYRNTQETNDSFNHLQHIIGLSYNFGAGDSDGDGVSDKKDVCPDIPGLKEFNGCPDTDSDGIPDNKDSCPEEAGPEDLQGCPDSDGDGIADKDDACPNEAGVASLNGCPDSDGDGVSDVKDKCPYDAGDPDNMGCPWADRDGDGVLDKDDKCPDEIGTEKNGGCPDQPSDLIDYINSNENRFLFDANSSKIKEIDSQKIEKLKKLLSSYTNVIITVEGHTSSDGSTAYNQKLSEDRAEAVKAYLIGLGLDSSRIETIGFGETKPIKPNSTRNGRIENRRAEINRSVVLKFN